MSQPSEAEIHAIVEKVLKQTVGIISESVNCQNRILHPKKVIALGADHGGYDLEGTSQSRTDCARAMNISMWAPKGKKP